MTVIRILFVGLISFITACTPFQTARNAIEVDLAQEVTDASLSYNEAYNKAVNSQILLNILRARDRLPRQYTTLSDLSLTPQSTRSFNVEPSSLKLGNNGIDPWVTLGGSYGGNRVDDLSFKVTPAVSEEVQTFYNPIDQKVIQRYFGSAWATDLLSETLLRDFRRLGGAVGEIHSPCTLSNYREMLQSAKKTNLNRNNSGVVRNLDCLIVRALASSKPFQVYLSDEISVFCFSDDDCTKTEEVSVKPNSSETENTINKGTAAPSKKIKFNFDESLYFIPNNDLSAATTATNVDLSYTTRTGYSFPQTTGNETIEQNYTYNTNVGALVYCYESQTPKLAEAPGSSKDTVFRYIKCSLNSNFSPEAECLKKNKETGACERFEKLNSALFYIQRHDRSDQAKNAGIYAVQRNSIDQMIYHLGESLRDIEPGETVFVQHFGNQKLQNSKSTLRAKRYVFPLNDNHLVEAKVKRDNAADKFHQEKANFIGTNFENDEDQKNARVSLETALRKYEQSERELQIASKPSSLLVAEPMFSTLTITKSDSSSPTAVKKCTEDNFIASVEYRGQRVFAGAAELWKRDLTGYDLSYCHFADRTGTVLTLISQVIEASQNPEKIENNNLFLR